MKKKTLIFLVAFLILALGLSACDSLNLPTVNVPAVDRQARDFGDFSGVTIDFDGGLSLDKISANPVTGGGNVWPLFKIDLLPDRLLVQLTDGRSVVNVGDTRVGLNFPKMVIAVKFTGGTGLGAPKEERTLFVGPNLLNCVGVAPQKCMQVKDRPEDPWKLFYDQIEGFDYEEGYLFELKVLEEVVANPPADASSLKLKLAEIVEQTAVQADLSGPTWMLETMNDQPPVTESEVTAIFAKDGSLYGSAGCNSYTTGYQIGGNTINIDPPASTRMACAEAGLMEQEAEYLKLLPTAKTFEIVGNRLTLSDAESKALLTYLVSQP